jgi:hypothetical protein
MQLHNLNPWVFGDEYLYISKARNIKWGIDVISDATLGHTYPPLYSYLIAPVINNSASSSYLNIQILNFIVSQFLLILVFFILNKVFKFTATKEGKWFLFLSYLLTTTLSVISGYYPVAMSENLYTPILLLIFSLFIFINNKKNEKRNIFYWIVLAFLTTLAILTRSIALTLIPSLILSLISINLIKNKELNLARKIKKIVLPSLIFLILVFLTNKLFNSFETSLIKHQTIAEGQKFYSANPYLSVITDFFKGKNNYVASFKVLGNSLIYIFISSFFLPILFYLNELMAFLKSKLKGKISSEFIFISFFGLFSLGLSYLHSYLGFRNNPIKYSTYFRYLDPTIAIFFVYGLLKTWQLINKKITLEKNAIKIFIALCLFLILMLPTRDFYISINSLGWGFLDLMKGQSLLIRLLLMLLSTGLLWAIKPKKKLLMVFALLLISINLATFRLGLRDMHNWQAGIYRDNADPVLDYLIKEQGINNFYLNSDFQSSDHSYLYYIKYRLLFENQDFIPMPIIVWQNEKDRLIESGESFVLVDELVREYENADEVKLIDNKWQLVLFKL